MARKIPIRASQDPMSGEMTTMVRFDEGGVNPPQSVKKRMNKLDTRDLSSFSEGEIIERVEVTDDRADSMGGGIPGMDGRGLF